MFGNYHKPKYIQNLLEYGHIEQNNMNPKCNPEMVLDLGVIAHSRIGEETPAIKLSKAEDYANPEAATKMTMEIYRIVHDDPFEGEFEGTSTEMALQLNIKFNDYQSMIEFYYDVQEMIDLQ